MAVTPAQNPVPSVAKQAQIGKRESQPPNQRAKETQSSTTAASGNRNNPVIVRVYEPERTKQDAEDERRDREERAQTDTWMVNLTLLIAAATAIQAIILAVTVGTSLKELRPYVSAWPLHVSSMDEKTLPVVTISLNNQGVTPAYETDNRIGVDVFPHPLPPRFPMPPLPRFGRRGFVLFHDLPFTRMAAPTRFFTKEEIAAVADGSMRLYAFGEVTYRRFLFFRHKTTFFASITAGKEELRKLTTASAENFDIRIESTGQHNEAT